jgi:heme exporter protein D
MTLAVTLGPYATFIVASYAIVGAVVAALIVWIALDYRTQQARLRELEAGGAKRRSGRGVTDLA